MAAALAMRGYDAPAVYAELIEPRYAPIADALVRAAQARATDDVLELGAGTGLVTKRVAGRVRSLIATDAVPGMLELARRSVEHEGVSFALVDYKAPLPFLDASFDLVLSGLTYVQTLPESVSEVARVLRPGGRFSLSMWGPRYHELELLSAAEVSIGRDPLPAPRPRRVVRLLERTGFEHVTRHDLDLVNEYENVEAYLEYRRGFGIPPWATPSSYERYLLAVERRAREDEAPDGSFALGWSLSVITARRVGGRRLPPFEGTAHDVG